MSMNVTYKIYTGDICFRDRKDDYCYSTLFNLKEYSEVTHVEVKVKTNSLTEPYKYFWLYLLKQIEPSFEIKGDWVKIGQISHGKMKVILTILRFLWEDTNRQDEIVPIVFNILMGHPETDPLKAIYLGNSIASNIDNMAHSLVHYMADKLPTIEDYRSYSGKDVYSLTHDKPAFMLESKSEELKELIAEKKDPFDYKPIFKYYGLE